MGDRTTIEWTDASWSPVTGCTKVSPGCDRCYAETFAERFRGTPGHYFEHGFDVQLRPHMLDRPLRWTRPRRIFVCSMADLFHDDVPDHYIAEVFAVMGLAPRHTFQVLTKRHGRMRSLLNDDEFIDQVAMAMVDREVHDGAAPTQAGMHWWPLPNVWVGVSAEDQKRADLRIPALLDTPAAVRWISAEPLLGPIALRPRWLHGKPGWGPEYPEPTSPTGIAVQDIITGPRLDWVVTGGESGRGARPMHPDWARSLRDQCAAAGVAFLHKQNGEYLPVPVGDNPRPGDLWVHGDVGTTPWTPDTAGAPAGRWGPHGDVLLRRLGKKAAGRELDGRLHDGYPAEVSSR